MHPFVLPAIKTATECADFGHTVRPYLPQLYALPQQVYTALLSTDKLNELRTLYLSTNPLIFALALSLFFAPIFLLVSEITKNYSQVDRAWSILPSIYVGHFAFWAHQHGLPTQRLDNILLFSVAWSIRLSFNYWRKGGYSPGSEDYRWETVKKRVGSLGMFIFNLTFISSFQSVLLFLITSPVYILLLLSRHTNKPMELPDIVFHRLLLVLILIEFFADQQQWNFQTAKKEYQKTAKVPPNSKYSAADLDRGFIVSGLWAWSRHPNFAAEQAIWILLYQWAAYESVTYLNWTFAGAGFLLSVFQGSTWLTEVLSAQKYPEYRQYQSLVGMFVPWPLWLFHWGSAAPVQKKLEVKKAAPKKGGKKH